MAGKATTTRVSLTNWIVIALVAAALATAAVLAVRAYALTIWTDAALFQPLDSPVRAALFTIVPALAATAVMAFLAARRPRPERDFIVLSAVLLLLSFIPDYILPDPNRTFAASTIAAFLHVVAAVVIVAAVAGGYRWARGR